MISRIIQSYNCYFINNTNWMQAALSLQAAGRSFIETHAQHVSATPVKHISLTSCCEIDKDCQEVLRATYGNAGHCIFNDILRIDRKKNLAFCVRHDKYCPVQKPATGGRN